MIRPPKPSRVGICTGGPPVSIHRSSSHPSDSCDHGLREATIIRFARPMSPQIDIVDRSDVDLVHAEALVALLERAHGSIVRVVVHRLKIEAALKPSAID